MDNATNTAFNHAAPIDEIIDALGGLQKSFIPAQSELLPMDAINELIAFYGDNNLHKAIEASNVPFPSEASKHGKDGMQSVFLDDFVLPSQGEYWERPSQLSFDALRAMSIQVPVLNAVVMTRTRQVQRFCRVSEMDTSYPAFEIRHTDRKHSLTDSEAKQTTELAKFIANCGFEFSAKERKKLRRDSFAQFMGKATRDSLILDSVGIEVESRGDKKLGMAGLYSVDGATIRLCSEKGYRGNPDIYAVQVVNGLVRTAYTFDDLIYEPRNSRSDVTAAGYGLPETELLVRVVTGFLNAMTLNNNVFDKNSMPKGVLHLSGNYSDEDLAAFRRYWQSMVKGIDNAFAMPVLVSKDAESRASFEKFGVDFSEMMFGKWMTFLTSLICAIYGMSPSEINFDSFTSGSTSALGGSDTAEKLAASKDSGLRPLLAYFENLITDNIISEFNPDYCFRFTGLDIEDADKKNEMRKLILTVNELRAEEGYEKLDNELGDAPANPALLNAWMQLKASEDPQNEQPADDTEAEEPEEPEDEPEAELKKSLSNNNLLKAMSEHDIWLPHHNVWVKALVEDYTQQGMIRTSAIRTSLNAWLEGKNYQQDMNAAKPDFALFSEYWTDAQAVSVESYLQSIEPALFSIEDTALLARLLVRQHLPIDVLIDNALNHTAQSLIMGSAQAHWEAKNPATPITEAQVAALQSSLPNTLESVLSALSLSVSSRAMLDYGAIRAAENVVELSNNARTNLSGVLMDHQLKRLSGDESATTAKLQQTLFDKYGDMNRDWRRIALTETGEMSMQGFIASTAVGRKVRRLEMYKGACPFCEKIHGTVMTVVDADKPDKDGKTEVWTGKTNIGRSSSPNKRTENGLTPRMEHELWWIAAGVQHPHCRGSWQDVPELGDTITNQENFTFEKFMQKQKGKS